MTDGRNLLDMWAKTVTKAWLASSKALTFGLLLTSFHWAAAQSGDAFESASEAYRSKNYGQAYAEFLVLAQAGDARSQTVLALMHKYGESVAVDPSAAFEWYMRAAIQGYPPALYNVGIMLVNGQGVDADSQEAKRWLQKASDAGYEKADDTLAKLNGSVVTQAPSDLPVAWSKSWNLRLPNELRFKDQNTNSQALKVIRIQLGAMSNLDRAKALWQRLERQSSDLLQSHQPIFRKIQSGDSHFYRVQIGPFESYSSANQLCEALAARSQSCLVMVTD